LRHTGQQLVRLFLERAPRLEQHHVAAFVIAVVLLATLACSGTEPTDEFAELPDIVYLQREGSFGDYDIYGYSDEQGPRELVPGPASAPRPGSYFFVRPTTGELLYATSEGGYSGYVLFDRRTNNVRQVPIEGWILVLSWSPLGDRLVVSIPTDRGQRMAIMRLDGTVEETICGSPLRCGVAVWAPSGDALVVSRGPEDGTADLWRVPLDGTSPTNLTQTPAWSETGPSWSPDGRLIAYQRSSDFQLMVVDSDGTGAQSLVTTIMPGDLAWSPDSRTLAVGGVIGGVSGIVLVPVDGGPKTMVTAPEERPFVATRVAWSPAGDRLVYMAYDGSPDDNPGVFTVRVDGSDRRHLNPIGTMGLYPAWISR
jgi:Tol biopolymer transport system component